MKLDANTEAPALDRAGGQPETKVRSPSQTPAATRMRRMRQRQRLGITLYTVTPETDWRHAMVRLGMISDSESRDKPKMEAKLSEFLSLMLRNAIRDRFAK